MILILYAESRVYFDNPTCCPNPYRQNNPKFLPMFLPLAVFVSFRSDFVEHITLRPYGQQLLTCSAPGTEKPWDTRCRRILGSDMSMRMRSGRRAHIHAERYIGMYRLHTCTHRAHTRLTQPARLVRPGVGSASTHMRIRPMIHVGWPPGRLPFGECHVFVMHYIRESPTQTVVWSQPF